MAQSLPLRPSVDHTPRRCSVLEFADETSTNVFESLACETARSVLTALADGPAPASELARRVDTSIQNARYHLQNLSDAGVVTTAGTRYSAKGKEMTVYGLAAEHLVIRLDADAPDPSEDVASDPPTRPALDST